MGLLSAALPAIHAGAKNPRADGGGFRTVTEFSVSIPSGTPAVLHKNRVVDKR